MRRDTRTQDALPLEVTSLVGRQAETGEVRRLLGQARLVTLTGPGGVGKTRLAHHVARTVRSAFADGVWTVPLADLSQADLLAATVSGRIGPGWTATDDLDDLVAAIGDRQMLVVLDNCEHLIDAAARLVTTLLLGCPHLRILTTSREALRVDGEALFVVPSLGLPEVGQESGATKIQNFDGVALFLERAGALNAEIAAGHYDEEAVAELCRRLDGLPLGIELAAAGSRWMSVESMLAHSEGVLAPGLRRSRSTADRHRSLRASLDYSYDLCSPQARVLWAEMSVFRGGATLEAIEAVCVGAELPAEELRAALCELVDKSLAVLHASRYTMLETIRLYGAQQLAVSGEASSRVAMAHLRYVGAMAEEVRTDWFGPHQSRLLARVSDDQSNVRAALETALSDPGTVGAGLRIASSLWTFWIGSGLPGEGRRWLSRLLAASDEADPARAPALWTEGFLCAVDGEVPAARELLAQCLVAADRLGDHSSSAHARCTLGVADLFDGRIDSAIDLLESGIDQERGVPGSAPYLADALINLGLAYCYRGDLKRAHVVLSEASQLCAARGEGLLMSWALAFLALEALLSGRPEAAAGLARESLVAKWAINNQQGVLWAIEVFAWAAVECGEPERAAVLLGASEARAEDFGPAFHGFAGMGEWHASYAGQAAKALGAAAFRSATSHGARLSIDGVVAVALGEAAPRTTANPSVLESLPLTRREREIAQLVATGKTNREIADALVIAPRTVDTHVQHILTKLDFTSRSQVAALIGSSVSGGSV